MVRVHVGGTFSDEWSTGRGVRQGGVTSAYLFNVFIDGILSNISSMNVGCRLGIKRVNVQSYADDIVLISPSVAALQLLLDKISELIDNHDLVINFNKTVAMTFSRRPGRGRREIKLFLNDNVLQVVHEFNYLGCVLTL